MTGERCQRLVVVHGPADPILESTLVFVGLHGVHASADVTVWAPIDLTLAGAVAAFPWPAPASGRSADGCDPRPTPSIHLDREEERL